MLIASCDCLAMSSNSTLLPVETWVANLKFLLKSNLLMEVIVILVTVFPLQLQELSDPTFTNIDGVDKLFIDEKHKHPALKSVLNYIRDMSC